MDKYSYKLESLHVRMFCVKCGWTLLTDSVIEDLKVVNASLLSPLGNGHDASKYKSESLSHMERRLCAKVFWMWDPTIIKKRIFKSSKSSFATSLSSPPLILKQLYPETLYFKFIWNWLRGSGQDFQKSLMHFHYVVIISPWKNACPLTWTNLKSFIQECFVSSHVEIVLWKKIKMWYGRTGN